MKICLISCGKNKQQGKHKAKDLYVGTYYRKCLEYAQKNFEQVYILSAKYGLLDLETEIESYELKITAMSQQRRKLWGLHVSKQIQQQFCNDEIYVLAGKEYYRYLNLSNATILFEGLSMGFRMKAMS